MSDEEARSAPTGIAQTSRWAYTALLILATMNLLDYMDRNILSAVLPQVQISLKLSNQQAGNLFSCFLVSYSLVGPLMGWAADRYRRTWLLAFGVGLWSLATFATGLASDYDQIWYARCLLGVGEATYGVIAPTMLMDLFTRQARARVLSAFYLAMPLGSALGIKVGGWIVTIDEAVRNEFLLHWFGPGLGGWLSACEGWQLSFFVVGLPALVSVLAVFALPEPLRGASEEIDPSRLAAHERGGATQADYIDLMVNSSYTYSVFGMTAYTFAIGGLIAWFPKFLFTTRGIPQNDATTMLSLITFSAAVVGMLAGGWLADRLSRRDPRALFLVPGTAMLLAVPFMLLALFSTSAPWIYLGILLAEMLMFINTGPCNAIIGHVVQPNLRAAALAIAIAVIHFLGDIWSPKLIGLIADRFGSAQAMESLVGRLLAALGANPTRLAPELPRENLLAGLLIVVPAVILSGSVLLAGARHLPREMALMQAKLRAVRVPPQSEATAP
jgi:MFS family permease